MVEPLAKWYADFLKNELINLKLIALKVIELAYDLTISFLGIHPKE